MILDGIKVAEEIQSKLQIKIDALKKKNIHAGLGIIMVGNTPESLTYVTMKKKKCFEIGISVTLYHYQSSITEKEIIKTILNMNENNSIHGIIIQLPLPKNINSDIVLNAVSKNKDVDGFNYYNVGKLFQNKDYLFAPCTPQACMELIDYYKIDVRGMNITIIGCSNLVGLPLSMLLLQSGATITLCHIDTTNTKEHCLLSDMVISCCGVPHLVKEDWISKGTIVIDIGINRLKESKKLVGDVDYDNVKHKCNYITPVPGGVGPVTIIMLLKQTIQSCEYINKISDN